MFSDVFGALRQTALETVTMLKNLIIQDSSCVNGIIIPESEELRLFWVQTPLQLLFNLMTHDQSLTCI